MTKKDLRKKLSDKGIDLDYYEVCCLCNQAVIGSMRNVNDFEIHYHGNHRHSIVFFYNNGTYDYCQHIIEDLI